MQISCFNISFLYPTRTVSYWVKNANVVPIHEKIGKQILKDYWVASLLRIFGKIFERLIYNNLYGYFIENNLISSDYSDFNPGDPWIYQLLSMDHDIYHYFDRDFEVTCVFLDLSKSFIVVWHNIFIYKLKQNSNLR